MTLAKLETILLFLVILFLPTQLGKHFWPNFSYIYSLKIDYLSPTIYFWDLLAVGLFVVWLVNKPKINKLALNLFLIFVFLQALSLIKAQNIGAGLTRLEQYVVSGMFGLYLASQDFKNLIEKIRMPLVLGILGESLIAILQLVFASTLGLWVLGERSFNISTPGIAKFDFYGFQFLRPYGTFPHPNVLAGFLLLAIVILKKSFVETLSRNGMSIIIVRISVILTGFTIFLTMSRVVILAGITVLGVAFKRKLLILLILLILSPILITRFASLVNFDNLTFLRREELLQSGWKVFSKYPIFGVGLNNFIPAMASNLVSGPSRFLQPVHNIFLLNLAETGIVGFAGLLVLIGYPILSSLRRQGSIEMIYLYRFRSKSGMTILEVLPWIFIIFLGMFDHYFLTLPQGYRMLFLIWGLSLSQLKKFS